MINGALDGIVSRNGSVSEIHPFPARFGFLLELLSPLSLLSLAASPLTEKRLHVKTVGGESRFIEGHSETRCWVSIKYDR